MNFTYNSESAVLKVLFLPLSACWKVTDNSENKFIIMILLQASQAGVQLSVCAVICFYIYVNFGIKLPTSLDYIPLGKEKSIKFNFHIEDL